MLCHQAAAKVHDTLVIDNLVSKAGQLELNGDYRQELSLGLKAFKMSEESRYRKGLSAAGMRVGSAYFNLGFMDSALWYFHQSADIRKKDMNIKGYTSACIAMNYVYLQTSQYDSAYAVLFDALRMNKEGKNIEGVIEVYIELGNLSIAYKDYPAASKYLLEAEKSAAPLNSPLLKMQAAGALGNYYYNTKDYPNALKYFLKVDEWVDRENLKTVYASNLNNIGLTYSALSQYKNATSYFYAGLSVYRELGMRFDEGNTCFNLGSMYNNRNMPDSAIHYLLKSLSISREIDDLSHVALSYEYLSDAYVLKNDYKTAYHYHVKSALLKDTLLNNEKISSISEMQTRYETEKKEQKIVLLDAQNKMKSAQRNIFIVGTILSLLLATAIFIGLLRTRKEKQISEALLLNILPSEVAEELKQKGSADARFFDEVTVLFTDIKNFTQVTEKLSPSELVDMLHTCFKAFDEIITKHRVEKIKTIGDSYMCAGGLPVPNKSNASDVVRAGLEIQEYLKNLKAQRIAEGKEPIEMRLGIHTGPVVAGIVGVKKFAYDIWGDTVNLASRMEYSGEVGKVNISEYTYHQVKDSFICTPRGKVEAKHKGLIEMYFVERSI